jgi:tRNA(fMet)-specific endonuclease VapC
VTRYLLDTNIISDLFRNPGGSIDRALRAREGQEIGTSLIVKGEILFGLKKNNNLRGLRHLELLLDSIQVWPLEEPTEGEYAALRAQMERDGDQVGANDLWIAAQALAIDAIVVSDDRAFQRMAGLKVENWLRDTAAPLE